MTQDRSPARENASSADQTRLGLIRAGLRLFGEKGFEGTSTREIAAEADANIGSIAYHFGSKEGLRTACAEHIVETISGVAATALPAGWDARQDREAARGAITGALETMVHFLLTRPQVEDFARFILRELAHPGASIDIIYNGVFEPLHKRLCVLWEDATGEAAESERTRITVFTLIGQVVYFRIARSIVLRRMGWESVGPRQAEAVMEVVRGTIGLLVDDRAGAAPDDAEDRS